MIIPLLFFTIPNCYSQIVHDDEIQLNKLPSEGILLDKGWKFHQGDDSAWAKPDYNDRDWQAIDPSLDIRHMPQIKNVTIFWMRVKLLVDSSLIDQPLGMTISQVGASEIYLDGMLLYKFGTVSNMFDKEHTHYILNRPFSIKLSDKKIQTIAVRYSFNRGNFLIKSEYPNSCFRIILNKVDIAYSIYLQQSRNSMFIEITQIALWLLLSLLCFGLYFSFQSQKAYWYIGVYSLLILSGGLFTGIIARELVLTSTVSAILLIGFTLNLVSSPFSLFGIYLLFNQKKSWFYYGLIGFGIFVVISYFFLYDLGEHFYGLYFLLYTLEFLRTSVKAMHRKRPGVTILLISSILFFIFIILAFIELDQKKSLLWAHFFAFLGVASGPICWSLFMSGEYARTGIALQNRVIEVEGLSQRAIAQEQEKQQILANQNETLENRVLERTAQLNQSIKNLQSTQAQLIQSEKMASLGELTAGIAHEIQNPLNFVNNFSEINTELIAELKNEVETGNKLEILSIADNLNENEKKINFHGKRADAIVKGMLQHSRVGIGHKEPTDLNRLVDEYLRLSYQGLRTRDSSFNSKIETDFDRQISSINIIPQDIGRVLLNVFNNAFYAVTEKRKQQPEGYEPTVSVNTKKTNQGVEITVRDNGNGIPKKILEKIFQPFFTTKPTGQGTGLGLSISYDIIKAHGGEISVDSKETEFTEFVVQIPIV